MIQSLKLLPSRHTSTDPKTYVLHLAFPRLLRKAGNVDSSFRSGKWNIGSVLN